MRRRKKKRDIIYNAERHLARELKNESNLKLKDARAIVKCIFRLLGWAIVREDRVYIPNVGTLRKVILGPKKLHSYNKESFKKYQNGEIVNFDGIEPIIHYCKSYYRVFFKAAPELLETLNEIRPEE